MVYYYAISIEWAKPQGEKLDILLDQIITASSSKKSLVMMGDCNIDQEKWDNTSYQHSVRTVRTTQKWTGSEWTGGSTNGQNLQCKSHVNKWIFCLISSGPCLLLNNKANQDQGPTIKCFRPSANHGRDSDHLPIMVEIDLDAKNSREVTTVTKRCFKSFNCEAFQRDLLFQDLDSLARCEDVDDMVKTLETQLNSVLDCHAPYKEVKMRSTFRRGLSNETKNLMKERNSLQRKMKKLAGDKQLQMHLKYRQLRNKCVTLQRMDTVQDNVNQFNGLTNPQDIWRATKSIITPRTQAELKLKVGNNLIQDETTVARMFNDFFVTNCKVENLRKEIVTTDLPDTLSKVKGGTKTQFVLKSVTEGQVLKAIMKLKNKSSTGFDQINSKVLKAGGEVLAIPLCYIINTSGKFSGRWKEAKLIPIHKKGDTQDVKNYRPVANLCVISKVLETVVHDQITRHCNKEDIIPRSQHGFQSGKSTLTATISMVDKWQQAMVKEQNTGVLQFDLSAAFDTLDHGIMARKLASLNFSDKSLKWVKYYLRGRVQQVQVGNSLSSVRHLDIGVPQGSVLSPLLFLIYISEIEEWVRSATVTGYADDTSLTMSSSDMPSLLKNLESEACSVRITSIRSDFCT
jgi:hypothetical protein